MRIFSNFLVFMSNKYKDIRSGTNPEISLIEWNTSSLICYSFQIILTKILIRIVWKSRIRDDMWDMYAIMRFSSVRN